MGDSKILVINCSSYIGMGSTVSILIINLIKSKELNPDLQHNILINFCIIVMILIVSIKKKISKLNTGTYDREP